MNKSRRVLLKQCIEYLKKAENILDDIKNDEEFSFDSLSEGLQESMRGQEMESNVDIMDDALEGIESIIVNLNTIN